MNKTYPSQIYLACQATSIDELAEDLFFVLQFTDNLRKLVDISELNEYLNSLGN